MKTDSIASALREVAAGAMVILVDRSDRENEGDLVMAAEKVRPKDISFMAQFGRGLICVPLNASRARELSLRPMTHENTSKLKCNFTVSVDAAKGITTGISAHDRARTVQLLASSKTKATDLVRPGHIFPLIAHEGGLALRQGHTEGSLALVESAGLRPISVICEVMGDDGHMLRGTELEKFAHQHGLKIISMEGLMRYLKIKTKKAARQKSTQTMGLLSREVEANLPTAYGPFRIIGYRSLADGKEHVALVRGDVTKKTPLVRVHSECLTGDVFESVRCDCNFQEKTALEKMGEEKSCIFIYLRQEGRGIGLINKLKAYKLQDQGLDTAEANLKLGFKADEREFDLAGEILRDLGVRRVRLMTNNPQKTRALEVYGIKIESRIPLVMKVRTAREKKYFTAKKYKLGHIL